MNQINPSRQSRVSRTAILRGVLLLFETYRPMKSRRAHRIFLQPARRGVGSRDVLLCAQEFFITIPRNA